MTDLKFYKATTVILTTILLITGVSSKLHKPQPTLIELGKITGGGVTSWEKADLSFQLDTSCWITVTINKDGLPVAKAPYSVKMHNKAMIVYKNGKQIGAFAFFKKPFELDNLILN